MYDRILVPTDGSPGADRVVDHAAELAAIHDAELHAIYVVNTAGYAGLPADTAIEGLGSMLNEQGEAALDRAEERVGDVPIERVLVDGPPSTEIVEYAESEGCDLIVMGTHGRGGIDRLLLGSVAERVVRTSSVPVLTVRVNGEQTDESSPDEATDGTENGR
ncbi:universal stress protein [Halococcus saccharolyticus]|uniref:UspA domain-containing protein n=1 Tax=Halococcus saccharolyticus DSM 5350 TaxID=1227455 RepID=M0MNV7_9EURY|nr:universal stress protein [Halococcus saccharolyticus]EMA46125.1 UspA domain-containing protein [Halococcus saccharolyticus DSM 5350]